MKHRLHSSSCYHFCGSPMHMLHSLHSWDFSWSYWEFSVGDACSILQTLGRAGRKSWTQLCNCSHWHVPAGCANTAQSSYKRVSPNPCHLAMLRGKQFMQNWVSTRRSEEMYVLCWALFWGMQTQHRTVKTCNISAGQSKKLKIDVPPWISIQN